MSSSNVTVSESPWLKSEKGERLLFHIMLEPDADYDLVEQNMKMSKNKSHIIKEDP